jgi:GNAT superfamily N-acetyltransferase
MAEFSFSAPELLHSHHDTTSFDCGKPPLNEFLVRYALVSQSGGSARTFVAANVSGTVVGYYSLAATSVAHDEVPDRVRQGQPRHPIPAILMARFAVALTVQGQGLGRALLRDAMIRSLSITQELGARVFVVDAKDGDAIRFYSRLRMMSAPNNPNRLYLLFRDVRRLLAG